MDRRDDQIEGKIVAFPLIADIPVDSGRPCIPYRQELQRPSIVPTWGTQFASLFLGPSACQVPSMKNAEDNFADLSQLELTAAQSAISLTERSSHLENAFRYAQLAVLESQRRGNVLAFRQMISTGLDRSRAEAPIPS